MRRSNGMVSGWKNAPFGGWKIEFRHHRHRPRDQAPHRAVLSKASGPDTKRCTRIARRPLGFVSPSDQPHIATDLIPVVSVWNYCSQGPLEHDSRWLRYGCEAKLLSV